MKPSDYIQFHKDFCDDMIRITEKKNHDYSNGGDAFSNFRQIGHLVGDVGDLDIVAVGFLTRMSDKFSRIGSFIAKGELLVKDESVMDSLKDLSNYSALFAGYLTEKAAKDAAQRTEPK